jgi:hypothetical protein
MSYLRWLWLVAVVAWYITCGCSAKTGLSTAAGANSSTPSVNRTSASPTSLCARISEIKVLPMKGERGEDPLYDAFMDAGEGVVPCLINEVTNITKMRDPRSEPGFPDIQIRVGDIAYFLIIDITKLNFTELLPADVQAQYKDQGVYAYFKYVQKLANRKTLQDKLHKRFEAKQKRTQ